MVFVLTCVSDWVRYTLKKRERGGPVGEVMQHYRVGGGPGRLFDRWNVLPTTGGRVLCNEHPDVHTLGQTRALELD